AALLGTVGAAASQSQPGAPAGPGKPPPEMAALAEWLEKAYADSQAPESVRMLMAISRGSPMGPNDGWFRPAPTRYPPDPVGPPARPAPRRGHHQGEVPRPGALVRPAGPEQGRPHHRRRPGLVRRLSLPSAARPGPPAGAGHRPRRKRPDDRRGVGGVLQE